jgi:hypothetical protein
VKASASAIAEPQPEQRAGYADGQPFEQDLQQAHARRQAEHAEQRKLRRALRDRGQLRGEDQKGAGQQGDQRQDVEVDAVGARQVGDARAVVVGHRAAAGRPAAAAASAARQLPDRYPAPGGHAPR